MWEVNRELGVGGALEGQECDEQVPACLGGGGPSQKYAVNVVVISTLD